MFKCPYRIHVRYILPTCFFDFHGFHVGKHTSHMDPWAMPIIYILVGGCQNPGRTVDEKKSVHFYEGNPIDSLTFKFLSFLPVFWQGPTYLESFGDSKTVLS